MTAVVAGGQQNLRTVMLLRRCSLVGAVLHHVAVRCCMLAFKHAGLARGKTVLAERHDDRSHALQR